MNLRALALCLLTITFLAISADDITPTNSPHIQEQEYAVAWDIDGVFFHTIGKMQRVKIFFRFMKTPSILKPVYKQWRNYGAGSIDTWRQICLQQGYLESAQYFQQMMLSKKLYPDTPNIIQRLHKRGYKNFVASNISQEEVALHKAQPATKAIFDCFIDGVMVDDAPGKIALKKPDPAYFKELKRIMQQHCGPNVKFVFIDDKIENIRAAEKEGFIGVHCTDPAKLRSQLRAIGLRF